MKRRGCVQVCGACVAVWTTVWAVALANRFNEQSVDARRRHHQEVVIEQRNATQPSEIFSADVGTGRWPPPPSPQPLQQAQDLQGNRVLRVAVIAPSDMNHQYALKKILPAITLAAREIETFGWLGLGPLPGWKIEILSSDSKCSSLTGPLAAFDLHKVVGECNLSIYLSPSPSPSSSLCFINRSSMAFIT